MTEDLLKRLREGTFGTDETKTDCVINAHMNRAATEIERLNAERDAIRAEVERLRREAAILREALTPFADEADRYEPDEGDGIQTAWASDFTIGSLRRARAALAETETNNED